MKIEEAINKKYEELERINSQRHKDFIVSKTIEFPFKKILQKSIRIIKVQLN